MKKFRLFKSALALATVTHVLMATPGQSQGFGIVSGDSSSSVMWGTTTGTPGSNFGETADTHQTFGASAGQVNAAEAGLLFSTDVTVMTIGAQNIISINGDSNSVTSNQDASSTGNVSTQSDISMGQR